jgi:GT2 family glycosyltransferase
MGQGAGAIAAVVVTWNRRAQLAATLARLRGEPIDRILVVDNGSTDGTAADLAACADPRLGVLGLGQNLGGAGGFEAGMRHAVAAHDPDWLLLIDDDARPGPGTIAAFRAHAAAGRLAGLDGIAGAVRYPDGRICEMNRPVLNPFWHPRIFWRTAAGGGRGAFHLGPRDFAAKAPRPIDGASFVGLFLSRRAVQLAGYPEGRLFLYAEDGLYTLGLTAAGGRLAFFPDLAFEHDCSTFDGQGRFAPLWKAYYYHRNLLILYRFAAGPWFWPALPLVLPKWLLKARAQGEGRRAYRRLLQLAVMDGLARRLDRPHAAVLAAAEPGGGAGVRAEWRAWRRGRRRRGAAGDGMGPDGTGRGGAGRDGTARDGAGGTAARPLPPSE